MLQTLSTTTRELFIAAPDNVFVECDLAAAEGRTVALLSRSEKLLKIFDSGGDVYCTVGSEMFGTPVVKGDKLRQLAKTSFLSLNYGAQPDTAFDMFWAEEDIRKHFPGLTVRDVEAIRNKYMKVLPEVFAWGVQEKKDSQARGYYLCPWNGRRMPFYGPAELSFAANFPNQTGVAWWICNTLRKVMPQLPKFEAELRTQVHDSLTVECPKEVAQDVALMLQSAMEGTLSLHGRSVQMKAEFKIGRTLKDVK
jgi:DNA polymerase I-like protein with 3'-5' exonuclease and polymerase domains